MIRKPKEVLERFNTVLLLMNDVKFDIYSTIVERGSLDDLRIFVYSMGEFNAQEVDIILDHLTLPETEK